MRFSELPRWRATSAAMPSAARVNASKRIITPFGVPVEPDV
jgi:hypothetical protein